jgi:hypothetical protein
VVCAIKKHIHRAGWIVAVLLALGMVSIGLSDCASSLPKSERVAKSAWPNFDAAKSAFDKVQPGLTTVAELREMGFDPFASANIKVLNYLDVTRRFLSSDVIKLADLDPAVRECIGVREACDGYEINLERIHRKRTGSVFLDLFNFKRITRETGWRFTGLFLIRDGRVSYKLWSGEPSIDRRLGTANPWGPLQEPADVLKGQIN